MRCPTCDHFVTSVDRACSRCGEELESATGDRADSSVMDRYRSSSRRKRPRGNRFDSSLTSVDAPALLDLEMGTTETLGRESGAVRTDSEDPQPTPGPVARSLVHPLEVERWFEAPGSEIRQTASFVFSSPFIVENEQYRDRGEATTFRYVAESLDINAFATDDPVEDLGVEPPAVVFLGGLARALRLTSALFVGVVEAARKERPDPSAVARRGLGELAALIGEAAGRLPSATVARDLVLRQIEAIPEVRAEKILADARSYAAAMDMFVIAHEVGHLALGHTLGRSINFDQSRNQEREADSFASSVISESAFREYLLLGQVFVTVFFSWMDHVGHAVEPTTHPLGRERFENALRSNREGVEDLEQSRGLGEDVLRGLLPERSAEVDETEEMSV